MPEVMKPSSKFMRFVEYCIKHAPILRNHIAFGEQMRDIESEITLLEEAYGRVLSAAQGRGMVSEMDNMQEVAVLVCGLHDRLAQYEARPTPLAPDACPYCLGKGEEPANKVMVRCRFCAGTGKRG